MALSFVPINDDHAVDPTLKAHATPREAELIDLANRHGGTRAAERAMGLGNDTVGKAVRRARDRMEKGKAATKPAPVPKVARYLLTAAQDDTDVHAGFWLNLLAYGRAIGAQVIVGGVGFIHIPLNGLSKPLAQGQRVNKAMFDTVHGDDHRALNLALKRANKVRRGVHQPIA